MGQGRYYATAIVIGVLIVCLIVLGARWHALGKRVPLEQMADAAVTSASAAIESPDAAPEPPLETVSGPAGKVDINTAGAAELAQLPGIGEVLAGRIIEYREAHGPFGSLEDLLEVHGIGAKKLAALRNQAVCSGGG